MNLLMSFTGDQVLAESEKNQAWPTTNFAKPRSRRRNWFLGKLLPILQRAKNSEQWPVLRPRGEFFRTARIGNTVLDFWKPVSILP
jgi:hypothetical protein